MQQISENVFTVLSEIFHQAFLPPSEGGLPLPVSWSVLCGLHWEYPLVPPLLLTVPITVHLVSHFIMLQGRAGAGGQAVRTSARRFENDWKWRAHHPSLVLHFVHAADS